VVSQGVSQFRSRSEGAGLLDSISFLDPSAFDFHLRGPAEYTQSATMHNLILREHIELKCGRTTICQVRVP
jgi:hypothetical protein